MDSIVFIARQELNFHIFIDKPGAFKGADVSHCINLYVASRVTRQLGCGRTHATKVVSLRSEQTAEFLEQSMGHLALSTTTPALIEATEHAITSLILCHGYGYRA